MADDTVTETQTVPTSGTMSKTGTSDEGTATPAKKSAGRSVPKWETEARDRLRAAIRRFARPLAELIARDAEGVR
jgi:N-acetylglutamate synthase/N-acetylornithine aminotransferase